MGVGGLSWCPSTSNKRAGPCGNAKQPPGTRKRHRRLVPGENEKHPPRPPLPRTELNFPIRPLSPISVSISWIATSHSISTGT
jgi:hypothetical protein